MHFMVSHGKDNNRMDQNHIKQTKQVVMHLQDDPNRK